MKLINKISKAFTVVAVAFLSFSCENDTENVIEKYPTIVEILESDATNFSILKAALVKTDLLNTFRNPGSYTVFAPKNSSFVAVGIDETTIAAMTPAQVATLKKQLQYHVLSVGTISADFPTNGYMNSFSPFGTSTSISISLHTNKASGIVLNGGTSNGGATVLEADINASNGVVHIVDAVLTIPKVHNLIIANPELSSLVAVLTSTPQAAVLTDLTTTATGASNALSRTVFAPTNTAFTNAAFLTGQSDANITKVLKYHLENNNRRASSITSFSSTALTINTQLTGPQQTIAIAAATVKITDITTVNAAIKTINIQGTNGVAHIIDKVLQPTL